MSKQLEKNILSVNDNIFEKDIFKLVVLVLVALLATFFLIPIERYLLPWPWFVEELVKLAVIWYLILPVRCWYCRLFFSLAFILIFSVAENILYFPFFATNQEFSMYWVRFTYPLLMHLLTFGLILLTAWWHKKFILIGVILAMFVHYFYNTRIVEYLGF